VVYGKTLAEAREKLAKAQQDARAGIPVPDKVWKLGPYLDYWLENFVELPQWQRGRIRPWAADEARAFLAAARPDPLYTAFVLLILYGLRRGEVLGLRWDDIDSDGGTIQIHQQLQRVRGELFLAPVKTQAGSEACRYSTLPCRRSSSRPNARPTTGSTWAPPGRKPDSSSPRAQAAR
jgi:integrase